MVRPRNLEPDVMSVLRDRLTKLSDSRRQSALTMVFHAVNDHDLPKFQRVLATLGIDESSRGYEQLMKIWDEMTRASRHD